ncbi:unnamed protein product [Protopolystoma xenopodis]|uniref:Uncharacterized protein n=1 Tax=Protopolystoma xenopodis TaxID=117903 RepID=A0A3S5A0Q4_9PLAT|nr:unnamed protein product [Protopolystoma xenopodis]
MDFSQLSRVGLTLNVMCLARLDEARDRLLRKLTYSMRHPLPDKLGSRSGQSREQQQTQSRVLFGCRNNFRRIPLVLHRARERWTAATRSGVFCNSFRGVSSDIQNVDELGTWKEEDYAENLILRKDIRNTEEDQMALEQNENILLEASESILGREITKKDHSYLNLDSLKNTDNELNTTSSSVDRLFDNLASTSFAQLKSNYTVNSSSAHPTPYSHVTPCDFGVLGQSPTSQHRSCKANRLLSTSGKVTLSGAAYNQVITYQLFELFK